LIDAAVGGVAGMQKLSATRRAELCRASGARLRGAWDDARQQAVRATLTGSPRGAQVWPRLQAALDGYASAWVRMHDEACDATERRGEQSVALFDLRMSCLEQRRKELDELTQLLAARPELEAKATQAAGSLLPLDGCADAAALSRVARAHLSAAELDELQRKLARARAAQFAGACVDAEKDARTAAEEARAHGAAALRAEATNLLGLAQNCASEVSAARASYNDAAVLAADAHDDQTVVLAACNAMDLESESLHFDDSERWGRLAAEFAARRPDDDALQGQRLDSIGYLMWRRGRYPDAERALRQALEHYARMPTRRDFDEISAELTLAAVLGDAGRFDEAAALNRKIVERSSRVFGPDHRWTIEAEEDLAVDEWERGDLASALRDETNVIARGDLRQTAGTSLSETNYGYMLVEAGRAEEAVPHFLRAIGLAESIKGDNDDELAYARSGLGTGYIALHKEHLALGPLQQALRAQTSEAEVVDRAVTEAALAQALWAATPERKRALELATHARDVLKAHPLGARRQHLLAAVEAWLAARGVR
jgi:tetratricopeptide (TPR) repeat protein